VYAASKLAGEHLIASVLDDHLIVRTAAIYGNAPCRAKGGRNFIGTMLHLAATRPEVKVVTDEITTPTYTLALARQIRLLAEKGEPGVYHATCRGDCSWFDFARAIFEETDTQVVLSPTTSAEFQSPVRRPAYSVLENRHAQAQGLDIMPPWRDALKDYLASRTNA
jgi:dTDP-4-dehydrorhamnose reductase